MNKVLALIDSLEKGGKPAQIGEVRNFGGKDYRKMGNGEWAAVVHPEEKQLADIDKKKEVSPKQALQNKLEAKTTISVPQKHLNDLKNGAPVEGQKTRSEKPMFTNVDHALAAGYKPEDFREVGNFFYDRSQKLIEGLNRLKQSGQKIDGALPQIQKMNERLGKQFISQAGRIEQRQTNARESVRAQKVKKSVVMMGHNDSAEIDTSKYATEHLASLDQGYWLEHIHNIMEGYQYGDIPRVITMTKGDLYLVKVDDGMYSGIFKTITPVEDGVLEDNAKVRLERMTIPSLIQFCLAKGWMETVVIPDPVPMDPMPLIAALQAPIEAPKVESDLDKRIRILELLTKLTN